MQELKRHNEAMIVESRGRNRRQWRWNCVLRERRSGFDRRRPETRSARLQERVLIPLRDNRRNVLTLLATANVLNVLDFLFTLRALDHGAVEANPVMRMLFSYDPVTAGSVKIALMLGVSLLVWRFRRYRPPLIAGVALAVVFGLVFIYHLYGVTVTGL